VVNNFGHRTKCSDVYWRLSIASLLAFAASQATTDPIRTTLCIKNKTSSPQLVRVTNPSFVENLSISRIFRRDPNLNQNLFENEFNNITVHREQTVCRSDNVYAEEKAPKVTFMIGDIVSKMYYYNEFETPHGWASDSDWTNPLALHGEIDVPFANGPVKRGFRCPGTECYLFTIGK
jgi:hypothetical protein